VSRALSNNPRIGLRTKQRVIQMAKELNFEPNAKAISFKQSKSFVIGVVLPYIREEFFSEAISGIEAAAMQNQYTILFGQSYDNLENEVLIVEAMKKQRVDGLIISLSKQTNDYTHLEALERYSIPVVYFDRVPPKENIHKVYCNLIKGTEEIVAWLFSQGCRRIALLNGPDKLQGTKDRFKGYMNGISRQKLKVDMRLVEKTDLIKENTHKAIQKLLLLKSKPNAIITFNEYVHMEAVQYAIKERLDMRNVIFASYANLPITSFTAIPPTASLEQYPYLQGEKAMKLMIQIINDKAENANSVEKFCKEEMPTTLVLHKRNMQRSKLGDWYQG
jgi:DNA-binding LacI/PurR family transcriptional regulator